MSGRRGAGEGAIYREKSGLWCAAVNLPLTGDGRRRRKYVRARTKAELLDKLATLRADIAKGVSIPNARQTVAAYLTWWESNVLPGTVKESTATGYRWILKKYVRPRIGTITLVTLGPEHVLSMLRSMERSGLSARTMRQTRSVLRRALRDAERYGQVNRNAAALVDSPRINGTKIDDALTAEEARAVLAAAKADPFRALAELVLAVGLRKGEAMALRWRDVDLDDRTVAVRGTLKRHAGTFEVDTPKSSAGVRVVPLPARVVKALRARRRLQLKERCDAGRSWQEHDFVFTSRIGTPLEARNVTRWWHGLCAAAGIERHRFHATRHTAATLMLEDGVPLEVISAILGHASYAITADVYARPKPDALRAAVDRMDRVLRDGGR